MLGKEGLKASQHHTVLEYHKTCGDAGEYARYEFHERHSDVIQGNTQEHLHLLTAIIYRHWLSLGDIVERHIHIVISQDDTTETFVETLRQNADEDTDQENDERYQQQLALFIHHKRYLASPIGDET